MKNNMIFKRLGAYLIDFLVITLIGSALTYISFINPKYEEYRKVNEEYSNLLDDYYEREISIEDFSEKTRILSYDMNKTGYVYIIGNLVITVLYFGVFQLVTKGQTLGKKLMKIRVVSKVEGKELKIYNYGIRLVILNGVILNLLTLIAICFSRDTYDNIYKVASNIDSILMIVIFVTIMLNSEGRGIHDILAGTKVIELKAPSEEKSSEFLEEEIKKNKDEEKEVEKEIKGEVVKKSEKKKSSNKKENKGGKNE